MGGCSQIWALQFTKGGILCQMREKYSISHFHVSIEPWTEGMPPLSPTSFDEATFASENIIFLSLIYYLIEECIPLIRLH